MKLNAENVEDVFMDCLFKDGEVEFYEPKDMIMTEGIRNSMGFNPERIEKHREDVKSMLSQLPEPFFKQIGGGWSFLNAIETRDGEQWAEHKNVEQLLTLGIGLGYASYLMPREMWKMFPGGMPYFQVDLEE